MPVYDELDPSTIVVHADPDLKRGRNRPGSLPALSILWHPDLNRVGSCAPLAALSSGDPPRRAEIARKTPPFDRMADLRLTRDPFLTVIAHEDQSLSLVRAPGSPVTVDVNGRHLESKVQLSADEVALGPVLTLARTIVVCLHRLREPRFPLATETFNMIGHSDAIDAVRRSINKVSDLTVPVLIRGESGTGKELVAAAIAAKRPKDPYIKVNMATLAANTAAAELFGHDRGAFTGAIDSRAGFFAEADGGTLFLDEIAATPLEVQPMLLRAIESSEIRSLGARKPRLVNVRLLAATDANLELAVQQQKFLEPLYHRLLSFQIELPPLRSRREDVGELLLAFFHKTLSAMGDTSPLHRSPSETPWLAAADFARIAMAPFPGNVRQLENVASQLSVVNRYSNFAHIDASIAALLTERLSKPASRAPAEPRVELLTALELENRPLQAKSRRSTLSHEDVAEALREADGNAQRAAAALGVSRTRFFELRRANPLIRPLSELSDEEIRTVRDACKGDIAMMARRLLVPSKPLSERVARLR